MQGFCLFILICAVGILVCVCADGDGNCHRVKRSTDSLANVTTPTAGNVTLVHKGSVNLTVVANATKDKKEPEEDMENKIRSAIKRLRGRSPTLHIRHVKFNSNDSIDFGAVHHQLKRITGTNEHCSDMQGSKRVFLISPHDLEADIGDEEHKDDKLVELLTGDGDARQRRHERFGARTFFHSGGYKAKSKRNAMTSTIRHVKSHKDGKAKRYDSPIENFMRLTKMLVDMSEGIRSAENPLHDAEITSSVPSDTNERLTEVIYKPLSADTNGNDVAAVVNPNEYLTNEFTGGPQQAAQHAILPLDVAGYHEYTFPLVSNFSPLKLLTSAIETEKSLASSAPLTSDKEDNDGDEYEMTCPVHFKRNAENIASKDGSGAGVLELCTCHLYRKKKQIA